MGSQWNANGIITLQNILEVSYKDKYVPNNSSSEFPLKRNKHLHMYKHIYKRRKSTCILFLFTIPQTGKNTQTTISGTKENKLRIYIFCDILLISFKKWTTYIHEATWMNQKHYVTWNKHDKNSICCSVQFTWISGIDTSD